MLHLEQDQLGAQLGRLMVVCSLSSSFLSVKGICTRFKRTQHLEQEQLSAQGGLVQVHEAGQLGQADGGVQLQQQLQGGQVALLHDQAQEAAQLQPVHLLPC